MGCAGQGGRKAEGERQSLAIPAQWRPSPSRETAMQRFVTGFLACVAATAAFAQERPQDRWNLTDLYATSTANEALLLEHVLKIARDDDERLLYLGSALETLRGTFFRQVMLAEFEREAHALVDKGETLTAEKLTRINADILRRYHGDQEGVVKIDDLYTLEWAYIPHFYYAFYVFQYATSISAASLLAEGILENRPGAREG